MSSETVIRQLEQDANQGADLSPGSSIAYNALHEIYMLRNKLFWCIHGHKDCHITDEGCHRCIGDPPEDLPEEFL